MANSVDPDKTAPSGAIQSDLDLHCLSWPICLKTWDHNCMGRVKRSWCLSPMRAASSEGSGEPAHPLLAHISSESRGIFRQKARSLASLNDWACAVEICHDGMLEDTNSLDAARIIKL